jgi:hypothetical protein
MSEINTEEPQVIQDVPVQPVVDKQDKTVPIVAILSVAIIVLACIVACTIATYAFLVNAPW